MELIFVTVIVFVLYSLSKDEKLLLNLYCIREIKSERIGKCMFINDYFKYLRDYYMVFVGFNIKVNFCRYFLWMFCFIIFIKVFFIIVDGLYLYL